MTSAFAKFCLFWFPFFEIVSLTADEILDNALLACESRALSLPFAGLQSYCWISR